MKCGVVHAGQRHQYQKFIEIVQQIGHLPTAPFVFYYWNDVANDSVHPHSTVIDGWQVNSVSIDKDYRLVRHTDQELTQQVARNLKRRTEKESATWRRRIVNVLLRYSLTVNLIKSLRKRMAKVRQPDTAPVRGNIHTRLCQAKISNRDIYALMYLTPSEEGSWFSDNPMARENKFALLVFRDFAERNKLPLVVVLIPVGPLDDPRGGDGLNTEHYREVRDFLDDNGIRFVDLTLRFHARGLTANETYWKEDPHLNPTGNRAIAEILIEEFPQLFSK